MRGAIPPLPNTPSWCGAQGQLYFTLLLRYFISLFCTFLIQRLLRSLVLTHSACHFLTLCFKLFSCVIYYKFVKCFSVLFSLLTTFVLYPVYRLSFSFLPLLCFFHLCYPISETGCGAHPASYPMGGGGSFPGDTPAGA
jgi:hypothetical protein